MSWKIYNGYRTKKGVNLFKLVREIRAAGIRACQRKMNKLHRDWVKHSPDIVRAELGLDPAKKITRYDVIEFYSKCARDTANRAHFSNRYELNASVDIREYKSRYYIIPHSSGDMYEVLVPVLNRMKSLERWEYHNQSDGLELEIGRRAFEYRGKVWRAVMGGVEEFDMLRLDVLEHSKLCILYLLTPKS